MAKRQNRGKLEETTRRFKRRAQRQDAAVLAIVLREWNRLLAKLLVKTERLKEAGTSEAAAARAEALAKEAGEQVEALNEKLCPVIEKGQEAAIETGIEQAETVLAEAGAPASSMVRVNKDAFEVMIGMTQEGSPLREVLDKGAGYSIKEAVMNVLKDGIAQGKNPEEIARDMVRLGYSSRKHALLVARTEVMRAYRISTKETYEANGVEKAIWCASESSATCAACWCMDGRAFDLDKLPNDHPNGRCTIVPVIDDEDEETWDSEERFKERLTEEEQKKILGPTRYELWKEGKLPWEDIPAVKPNDTYGPTLGMKRLPEQYSGLGGQNSVVDIKHFISDKDVNNVGDIRVPNMTDEQNKIIRDFHKELLRESADSNYSNEVAYQLNSALKRKGVDYGDAYDVTINLKKNTTFVMHNHPNNTSFSVNDINWFVGHSQVTNLSLVTNTGKVELLTRMNNFDEAAFKALWEDAKELCSKDQANLAEYMRKALSEKDYGVKWSVFDERTNQ